jgi:fluoride ion exporter CrcB/FEX
MKALLIVAAGGGLGSMGRYLLSEWTLHRAMNWQFPMSALAGS